MTNTNLPDLTPVINWLENGCDPKEAAKELRLHQQAIDALKQALEPDFESMFMQTCSALGAIHDALGLDPDDAEGAGPIIEAIEELKKSITPQWQPIDMILHCPSCGLQHIDAPDERTPDWKNEPHRSHLCHGCGCIWRPADVPTNGVAEIKTSGKNDSRRFSRNAQPAPPTFQRQVQGWMLACFGSKISRDKMERNHRFFEESTELVQACGMTVSEAHQLVDYVYGRPVGEPKQEAGGVMVTLAALCLANEMDMHDAGETELARVWTKITQIRDKQAAKPKHSPLPIAQPAQVAVPKGFDRQDLLDVEEALRTYYPQHLNQGNITGPGDYLLETAPACAARLIRALLNVTPNSKKGGA